MQTRTPNLHSLIGPKSTVLIDWNRTAPIGQWRSNEAIAPIGQGMSQSCWLKLDSRNSFIMIGSSIRNTVKASSSVQVAGSLVQASPLSVACVKGPYLAMAARLCF